jgi:hypothetical protein
VPTRSKAWVCVRSLWIQVPVEAWIVVSCEGCVLSDVSARSWSLVHGSLTEWWVCVCLIVKPRQWGALAHWGLLPYEHINCNFSLPGLSILILWCGGLCDYVPGGLVLYVQSWVQICLYTRVTVQREYLSSSNNIIHIVSLWYHCTEWIVSKCNS